MKSLVLTVTILILSACQNTNTSEESKDRYAHIKDLKAKALLRLAIQHAGGIEAWESIQSLSYTKDFSLLMESGEIEKTYKQIHKYQYNPIRIDIQSTENDQQINTVFENGRYTRTVNGSPVELSQDELASAVNSSTYVIGIPFNLLDPGANISYEGTDTLSDGRMAEVLKVSYDDAEKNQNLVSTDLWRFYIDPESGAVLANRVQTGDHTSLVENLSFERVGEILFYQKRKSYRLNNLGKKAYLRAEYDYGNYALE